MTGSITALVVATALFVVSHLALANAPLRDVIVTRLGEPRFLLLYSVLGIVLFIWAVAAYGAAPYEEVWWAGAGVRVIPLVLMPFAFILLVCGHFTPNPTAVMQDRLLNESEPAAGIIKITRHPAMWGITLWAAGHLLVNGDVASIIFMGAMLVLALAGMVLIDRKKQAKDPAGWARFAAVTSLVPFAALIGGRTTLRLSELGWWKIGLGVVLYLAFLHVHTWLFGVSPLPG